MSMEYRIIWVDDSPAFVASIEDDIVEHIREKGFEPIIEKYEDADPVEGGFQQSNVDLVIIDHNLYDATGDKIILDLRAKGHFTEIIYYSVKLPPQNEKWNGVFLATREQLPDVIQRVVDLTIHKLRDLGVFRGLMIAQCIDLEVKIEELILKWFDDKAPVIKRRLMGGKSGGLDFNSKASMLGSILKEAIKKTSGNDKTSLEAANTVMKRFGDDIIQIRNLLAHGKPRMVDGKFQLEGRGGDFVFTDERVKEVRAQLRKHLENLNAIEELF